MTDYIGIIGLETPGPGAASALAKKTRVIGSMQTQTVKTRPKLTVYDVQTITRKLQNMRIKSFYPFQSPKFLLL